MATVRRPAGWLLAIIADLLLASGSPSGLYDTRLMQVKVKKLDGELARYRDQMKKMRPGPGKVGESV